MGLLARDSFLPLFHLLNFFFSSTCERSRLLAGFPLHSFLKKRILEKTTYYPANAAISVSLFVPFQFVDCNMDLCIDNDRF